VKYKFKKDIIADAESPSIETIEYTDGTAKVVLTFFTDYTRAGIRTDVEHVVVFKMDYDDIACVSRTLAATLIMLKTRFVESIDHATESVRRQFNG